MKKANEECGFWEKWGGKMKNLTRRGVLRKKREGNLEKLTGKN